MAPPPETVMTSYATAEALITASGMTCSSFAVDITAFCIDGPRFLVGMESDFPARRVPLGTLATLFLLRSRWRHSWCRDRGTTNLLFRYWLSTDSALASLNIAN